ncbi:MAG TPA: gluconeogenesis factor YvcK family protein, partial [Patescibacteria group bacterium]|nr:gluconeogenesis factor YvcK family protein [Patescibacteria group bacterium]
MDTKNVVTIGGGTGSFMLLSGLKKYPINISAIVSMADDGGSTGVLRDELGVLPPGDVRQCLVALSDSSEIMRNLLNYRFENGGLKGHSFGNLFLSALEKISGDFNSGVEEAIKILNIKGKVIPVTNQDARLFIELGNGKILKGEDEINHAFDIEEKVFKKIYFYPKVKSNPQAIKSILEA